MSFDTFFILLYIYFAIVAVQEYFSIGTAYRLTKYEGGDGVDLWKWGLKLGFASLIPGVGIYIWYKYRNLDDHIKTPTTRVCIPCGRKYDSCKFPTCPECRSKEWKPE